MKDRILNIMSFLIIAGCGIGCTHVNNGGSVRKDIVSDSITNRDNHKMYTVFGVETEDEEYSVLKSLDEAGILKIDSISMDDSAFQFAIVEFAGVKFGVNEGFVFITSQQDLESVNALVNTISKYYGVPDIDDETDDPEYRYYHWNLYYRNPKAPHIFVRPLHSEEGGLTMIWEF